MELSGHFLLLSRKERERKVLLDIVTLMNDAFVVVIGLLRRIKMDEIDDLKLLSFFLQYVFESIGLDLERFEY